MYLFVTSASRMCVVWYVSACDPSSHPASCSAPCMMPYFAFMMAVSLSSFVSIMMYSAALSRVAIISSPFGRVLTKSSIFGSFSSSFIDRKRVEYLYLICSSFCISFLMLLMPCSMYLPWFRWTCLCRLLPCTSSPS